MLSALCLSHGWEGLGMYGIIESCYWEKRNIFYSLYGSGEMGNNLSSHAEACLELKTEKQPLWNNLVTLETE